VEIVDIYGTYGSCGDEMREREVRAKYKFKKKNYPVIR
jgi:hypothetical protein